jgi:hypothetical protein
MQIQTSQMERSLKVVSRLASNFFVKRFGNSYRKDDILRAIKPIRRTIDDENYNNEL